MRRVIPAVFSAVVALFVTISSATAAQPAYGFKVGEPVCYEIKITQELPERSRTTVNYIKYRPSAVSADGQITLRYDWATTSTSETSGGSTRTMGGRPPAFLGGPQPMDDTPSSETIIDSLGNVVKVTRPSANLQLDDLLGPAYGLMLLPLPPAGQTTWNTQRPVVAYNESVRQEPGGMWGHHDVTTRTERACKESVTFTAAAPVGDLLTVQRTYDLASDLKLNDTPVDHLSGTGQYVFDLKKGAVKTFESKLVYAMTQENVSIKVPVTVTARRLEDSELAKMKADVDAQIAKDAQQTAEREKQEAVGGKEVRELPAGMTKTKSTPSRGGGDFIRINAEGKSVIGFSVTHGSWGGQKVLRMIQPLYEKPEASKAKDAPQVVLAKDGYALGGLWVNADDTNVIAIRPIFMKKNATNLDIKSAYVGPWIGTLSGPSRVRFGGTGQFVTGIFGRQGLNTAAIGLVIQEADPTDDPNFKGDPKPKDPTDDPNFKG
ncbi:MAG: hypothetical protein JWM57_4128 [Phycisphaerales bacterium]|nr:hypothetical protein [Phycisphaerales bacterium]